MVTVDILFLFQVLARRLSDSHCYGIGCGYVINSFYYVEICYLYTLFGKSFYHEWILNFFKCFFYIFWDDLVVFYFSFVNVVYCIDSHISKQPCELGMNPTWLWYVILFMGCWIWFANILLRISASIFTKILACKFPFWWVLYLALISGWWWLYEMSSGVFLPFQCLEEFERNQYKFFFENSVEFTCELIWSWTFVCRKYFFN